MEFQISVSHRIIITEHARRICVIISLNKQRFDFIMFGRLRKAGAKVAKLDNLGLNSLIPTTAQKEENTLCGVIRKEALLPDELNTTDFTKEQRKKRSDVILSQIR